MDLSVDEAHATVSVNGDVVVSGAPATRSLHVGANTITVVVTAQDNTTTHAYTLTVTRAPSADADPSGLTVSVGTRWRYPLPLIDSYAVSVSRPARWM